MTYTIKDINKVLTDSTFEEKFSKTHMDYDEFIDKMASLVGLDDSDTVTIEELVMQVNEELSGYTITLPDGEKIIFYDDPTSNHYDGAEIGVIMELSSGQFFKMSGYYSSWDASEYDGELHEVTKKVQVIELTTFEKI